MKKQGLLFSLILCTLLSACGGKGESADDLLAYYTFEGDTIPSIEQFINDETGGRLVATLSPDASGDTGEQNASDEADTQDTSDGTGDGETTDTGDTAATAEEHNYLSYDYQQFVEGQPTSIAKSYVTLLEGDDIALHTESEDEPSFDSDTGSVTLIRQAVATDSSGAPQKKETASTSENTDAEAETDGEESGDTEASEDTAPLPYSEYEQDTQMRFRVRIDWTPTSVLITLDKTDGQDFVTSLQEAGTFLSFSGAKALMSTVTPAEIGLPGESMSEYSLKPGPGFVMVDGQACLTVYVYGKNSVGTNSLMGTYFISSDCTTLYRQVGETSDEVEEIQFPTDIPDDLPTEGETAVKTEPTP
ncbi:hypothetical protein [Agathobaculum sp. Marseille-P7918]|uniref:hypothetical protein n=1 Tax=Agathobaculum sp. Marseille-P7918 TaxID=2479843 RepID=UPI00356A15A9